MQNPRRRLGRAKPFSHGSWNCLIDAERNQQNEIDLFLVSCGTILWTSRGYPSCRLRHAVPKPSCLAKGLKSLISYQKCLVSCLGTSWSSAKNSTQLVSGLAIVVCVNVVVAVDLWSTLLSHLDTLNVLLRDTGAQIWENPPWCVKIWEDPPWHVRNMLWRDRELLDVCLSKVWFLFVDVILLCGDWCLEPSDTNPELLGGRSELQVWRRTRWELVDEAREVLAWNPISSKATKAQVLKLTHRCQYNPTDSEWKKTTPLF